VDEQRADASFSTSFSNCCRTVESIARRRDRQKRSVGAVGEMLKKTQCASRHARMFRAMAVAAQSSERVRSDAVVKRDGCCQTLCACSRTASGVNDRFRQQFRECAKTAAGARIATEATVRHKHLDSSTSALPPSIRVLQRLEKRPRNERLSAIAMTDHPRAPWISSAA
jgi:hypothetical protein